MMNTKEEGEGEKREGLRERGAKRERIQSHDISNP
jgi:hypothetical protein